MVLAGRQRFRKKAELWSFKQPKSSHEYIIRSNEANFYFTLPLNNQNNRQCSESQPYNGTETPLNDQKNLIWCVISAN